MTDTDHADRERGSIWLSAWAIAVMVAWVAFIGGVGIYLIR